MEHPPEFVDKTRTWFETSLNEHGYSFQQSILKAAQELCSQQKSGWGFQVSEFPVEVRGRGTRIDFILQRLRKTDSVMTDTDRQTTLMLAECKRANPAYANWCFAKAPYLFRGQYDNSEALVFEEINPCSEVIRTGGGYNVKDVGMCRAICSHRMLYRPSENVYHVAVEVKHTAKGNCVSGDPGKDAVESAASQLCQGLNGMVHFLARNDSLWEKNPPVTLLPVIFTTANLWASNADLSGADIETGDLSFSEHNFRQVPWLFFQYHLSPGIKHSVPSHPPKRISLTDILQAEYVRTIPIVSSSGVEDFLRHATALDFMD